MKFASSRLSLVGTILLSVRALLLVAAVVFHIAVSGNERGLFDF